MVASSGDPHRAKDARKLSIAASRGESIASKGRRHGARQLIDHTIRARVVEVLAGEPTGACGWKPPETELSASRMTRPQRAGCGVSLARESTAVRAVEIVEIDFTQEHHATVVRFVLLDGDGRRVKPTGGKIG